MQKRRLVLLLTAVSLLAGCNSAPQNGTSPAANMETSAEEVLNEEDKAANEEAGIEEGNAESNSIKDNGAENSDTDNKDAENSVPGGFTGNLVVLKPTDQELAPRRTVYPETIEYTKEVDGVERSWEVYVPTSYDGSQEVPLVLAVHGASGHTMPERSSWHFVAEKNNFIVAYPESLPELWHSWPEEGDEINEINYFDTVIASVCEEYKIDKTRLYIHGQSAGDMMTSYYIYSKGEQFAAAAPVSLATTPSKLMDEGGNVVKTPGASLPVLRLHGETDYEVPVPGTERAQYNDYLPRQDQRQMRKMSDQLQKNNWIAANGAEKTPLLSVQGHRNIEIYPGTDADFVFFSIQGGAHNTELDMMDFVWDNFFSGYRRVDGKVVREEAIEPLQPDKNAVALAAGATKAYVDNELVDVQDAKVLEEEGVIYVPASFLAKAFPGTEVKLQDNGLSAMITAQGKQISIAAGHRMMMVDNQIVNTEKFLVFEDTLMVPIGDIAHSIYGYQYQQLEGAAYMVDHEAFLSEDMADTIKIILGVEKAPEVSLDFQYQIRDQILDLVEKGITNTQADTQ